jgi:hypothetical protein
MIPPPWAWGRQWKFGELLALCPFHETWFLRFGPIIVGHGVRETIATGAPTRDGGIVIKRRVLSSSRAAWSHDDDDDDGREGRE